MITIGTGREVAPRLYEDGEKVRGVEKRVLIGPKNEARRFVMRHFRVGPGGHSPYHKHPWEHEVYVLAGRGTVRSIDGGHEVEPGSFVFVPPLEEHQFLNAGTEPFEFLCIVPPEGDDG